MNAIFQVAALAVVTAICCCALRSNIGSLSIALSITACVLILILTFRFLKPIIDILDRIQDMTGMTAAVFAPLVKVVGIGFLAQIAGAICEDAGEKTLHRAVEIAGSILSVYVSLPLLSAVLELLEELLNK